MPNVDVINAQKTLDLIKEFGPEHVDMSEWFVVADEDDYDVLGLENAGDSYLGECGTTACLAGFAATVMAKDDPQALLNEHTVAEWLQPGYVVGKVDGASIEMSALFNVSAWSQIGDIGEEAMIIAGKDGEYKGVVHLLEGLIKEALEEDSSE